MPLPSILRSSHPPAGRTKWPRRSFRALLVSSVMLLATSLVAHAVFVPSGSVNPHVWDSVDNQYENGNPSGYSEGETAAMAATIVGEAGNTYDVDICLEVESLPGPRYAFSQFDPWDRTVTPAYLPDANGDNLAAVDYGDGFWDQGSSIIWGWKITINSLTPDPPATGGGCDPDYVGTTVNFTVDAGANEAVIVFGGRFAIPGATLPAGLLNDTVPVDQGAASINGTFQSRLEGAGDKTINFSGIAIQAGVDLTVVTSCPDYFENPPPDLYTYQSVVTNTSAEFAATGVELVDTLPDGVTYDSFTSSPAGTCSAAGQVVTCTLTNPLPAGDTWTVDILVDLTAGSGTPLTNTVTATATNPDFDSSNNTDQTCTSTTPVTLAYFEATRQGDTTRFEWITATEVGNVGFNLYAVTPDGLQQINTQLIPTQRLDSTEPETYAFEATGLEAERFVIEDVAWNREMRRHGQFDVGVAYGQPVALEPIDWAAIHGEHAKLEVERRSLETARAAADVRRAVARSLEVESAAAAELSPRERLGPDASAAPVAPAAALVAGTAPLVKLTVAEDGLYRVTYEDLLAAGYDFSGAASSHIALLHKGQPVAITVSSGKRFGPGGYVEFHGQAADTLYTRTNAYHLTVDRSNARRVGLDYTAPPVGVPSVPYYVETVEVDENKAYSFAAPHGDPWYDARMLTYTSPRSWTFPLQVDNLVLTGASTDLSVGMWGVTNWPGSAPDHHVQVALNGNQLADEWFDGLVHYPVTAQLAPGLLQEGGNQLVVTMPGDSGYSYDLVNLDRYSVTYPRAFMARNGALTFEAAGPVFEVDGLTSASVLVYRLGAGGPVRMVNVAVRPNGAGGHIARFAGTATATRYLVASADGLATAGIEAPRATDHLTTGSADYLVIAHPSFLDGVQPLVAHHESQGLVVKVVNALDVYEKYGWGIFGPDAIQAYIADAKALLGVRFVLLVGGDTYDYLGYLGNSMSFIPTLYAQTDGIVRYAPVDPLLADIDGDGVQDVAIGRLPVRTVAELDTVVAKTLAYAVKDYGQTGVFAADSFDSGVSFTATSHRFISRLPSGWAATAAHIDELGLSAARTELLAKLNEGVALTSFVGHSGLTVWTFQGLFRASDATVLTNAGRPTVVTQWGCWNTYHVAPAYNTLGHTFLLSGDRGAAAVLGATTLTLSSSEERLGDLLMPRMTEPGKTVGEAVLEAKQALAQTQPELVDVLAGWSLLGDPAIVVTP